MLYLNRLLLVPLLALLAATAIGAQCYPPGSCVVIFLQGVYTGLDEDGTMDVGWEDHAFDKIKASFIAVGYNEAHLLGLQLQRRDRLGNRRVDSEPVRVRRHGSAVGSEPCPARNDAARLPREASAGAFHARRAQPGRLPAFLEGERESRRAESDRLGIDTVVTLGAPLKGVAADKKIALDVAVGCATSYVAVGEVVADEANVEIEAVRTAQMDAMRAAGIRLATLGNNGDCLYNLPRCSSNAFSRIDDSPQAEHRKRRPGEEVRDSVVAVPQSLRHLCLPAGANRPDRVGRRTLAREGTFSRYGNEGFPFHSAKSSPRFRI